MPGQRALTLVLPDRTLELRLPTRAVELRLPDRSLVLRLAGVWVEVGIREQLAEILTLLETVLDSGTIHPTEAREEILVLSEAVTVRLSSGESVADAVSVAELVVDRLSEGSLDALSEALDLGESAAALVDLRALLSESILLVESSGSSAGMREALTQAITVAETALDSLQHPGNWQETLAEALGVVEAALAKFAAAEARGETAALGELGASLLAFHAQLVEALVLVEQGTGTGAAKEARAETVSTSEQGTSKFGTIDARAETVSPVEARTDRGSAQEPHAEGVTPSESEADVYSDAFDVLWAAMPKPAPAGGYPFWTGAAWAWHSAWDEAQDVFGSIEAASAGPGFTILRAEAP